MSRLARLLRRLSGSAVLARLDTLEKEVSALARTHRETASSQTKQLERLTAVVAARSRETDGRDVTAALGDVRAWLLQQDRALEDALKRSRLFDRVAIDDRRFARRMERFRRHPGPLIVGPWTGEIGFELLYWIPFIRWVFATYGIDTSRVTVVSRGGVASWYGALAARYVDLFSLVSPEEYRTATEFAKKQREVGPFDADIVARVRETRGPHEASLFHPGMMYRLFNPLFRGYATLARIQAYTRFELFSRDGLPRLPELPPEYTAARFYFSDCFPDTPANRAFVASTLDALSQQAPVVLLNTPFAVDDHSDFLVRSERIVTLNDRMTPETNLAVQTAVIAGAKAFVGTYGGYSYLAPFYGVPALAFYSARTFKAHHLQLAQEVFEQLGSASVVPLDVRQVPLVQRVTARTVPQ